MVRTTFQPNLVWVGNDLGPTSKSNVRSHIVKEGYRRKKVLGRAGLCLTVANENHPAYRGRQAQEQWLEAFQTAG